MRTFPFRMRNVDAWAWRRNFAHFLAWALFFFFFLFAGPFGLAWFFFFFLNAVHYYESMTWLQSFFVTDHVEASAFNHAR